MKLYQIYLHEQTEIYKRELPDLEDSVDLEQQLTENYPLDVHHLVYTTELVEMIVH